MKTSSALPTRARVRACAIALLCTAAAGSAFAQAAPAAVTRGAVAVTSSIGQNSASYAVERMIDQSGLSLPYITGTTAFDGYVATALNSTNASNSWYAQSGFTKGFLSFDLGAAYDIDGLALFGANSSQRVTSIRVYADDDGNVANGNTGLLFTSSTMDVPAGSTGSLVKPNVFSFNSGASTRYITIEILGTAGTAYAAVGEVVFRQSPAAAVPEPGTYVLMGLGLLAVGGLQRRRMAAR